MGRKYKSPSIKDIAREAGVAISTVSNVINKKGIVTAKTRKKVSKAIDKLGYRPNIIARSLRTRSTNTIGVILQDISNPFGSHVIKGMEEVARKRGYILILGCTFYDKEEEERQVHTLLDQFVDGLIFISGYNNESFVEKIYNRGIPLVSADRELKNKGIPSVLIDNKEATQKAVDYLCKYGHRDIGYITFNLEEQTTTKNRYLGYIEGLKKNNLEVKEEYIIMDDYMRLKETEGTYEVVKSYIKNNKMPSAFITLSDVNAYGLIKALKEEDLRVPQDVSVVGFDNVYFSNFLDPGLTTIKQPKKLMGQKAMNLLIDIVERKDIKTKNILLPTTLIERDSVDFPAGKTKDFITI
ncbi:MAG: LacI family DNA-binding transcriptional regulator [Actinomycetota bacterium]